MSLEDLRRQYTMGGLREEEAPQDPLALFDDWMQTALSNVPDEWVEPYAMTLATSSRDGGVSARIVLLRGYDADGFVFYTNYSSLKGQQLEENQQAALVFYWGYLERQVRLAGSVEKVSREKSEAYFHKRPRGSQISAAVSRQSEPIESRAALEAAAEAYAESLGGGEVPIPHDWGGYRVQPQSIEFWQGRKNRLHDRLVYQRKAGGAWSLGRLRP